MTESTRSHADGAPPPSDVPEPSLAERAKTLATQGGSSTLSTLSKKHPGFPFGSVMPYGLTEGGEPLFLISSMAMHTHNLLGDPRATLLITQATNSASPLGAGRVSLMGEVTVLESEVEVARAGERYIERNPEAKYWMHFGDFKYFQMRIIDVYFIGGFGVMGWIPADTFRDAAPDPLAAHAEGILQHMNDDHEESMILLAKRYHELEATAASMTSIDRLGFHLRLNTAEGAKGIRIAYPQAITSHEQVRQTLVDMVKQARDS